MALHLGELNAVIDADDRGFNRGIDASDAKMAGFQRGTEARLDDMQKTFGDKGEQSGKEFGDGLLRAFEGVEGIFRNKAGRLQLPGGRFVKEGAILTDEMLAVARAKRPAFRKEGEQLGDALGKGFGGGLRRNFDAVNDELNKVNRKIGGTRAVLATLGKVTAFAGIITGAAGAASALGPVVSLAGALVVASAGIAAVLPAALLSGVAAAAALKIGLTGVGDAIAGDEEALEKLPGPARDFVKAVKDLKPAWDDVTKSIQSRLFEGVAGTFKTTAEKILPRLKSGLGSVADGWNSVFREGLKAATTPRFLAGLDAVLKATGRGLTSMATGLDGWLRGIGVLASAAAPLLEDMGDYAGRLGDRFGEWMEQARASGQLQSTLQTMIDTLSTIGGIVTNVGSIFNSVFSAAGAQGGGLLGIIETLTGKAKAFFDSAEGKTALNDFFARLNEVGAAVSPIVLAIVGAVAALAPKIADIAEGVGPTFADLVQKIGDNIAKIDAENLANGLVSVLEGIEPLIDPIGSFVGGLTSIDGIVPVVAISLGVFTIAVWALNSALWANPIVWIIGLLIALIAVVVLVIMNWDKITAVFSASWLMIKEAFHNGVTAGKMLLGQLVDWVSSKVNQAKAIFAMLGTIPGQISDWFGRAKDAAVDKLNGLIDAAKGIPDKITGALGDLGNLLKNAGRDVIQGLLDGIDSMIGSVQDKLSELTGMLPDWKGPAAVDKKILAPAGRMVLGGFIEGLDSMIPQVQRTLQGLTTDIGLQVDGAAAPGANRLQVEANAFLSEEDRALLRELAESRTRFDIRTDANTRVAEIKRDAMVVA